MKTVPMSLSRVVYTSLSLCIIVMWCLQASVLVASAVAGSYPTIMIDTQSCFEVTGWVCDPDEYSQVVRVHFYRTKADGTREFILAKKR